MSNKETKWFERQGNAIEYPQLLQGNLPHCVYASVAAAVNHVSGSSIWTPQSLFDECTKQKHGEPNFGVANIAVEPVKDRIEKVHHNSQWESDKLSPSLVQQWLDSGAVVVLSMERETLGGWHMFSVVAIDGTMFQVWDTNGYRGFLSEDEISSGFDYPNGWKFVPHDSEDALIIRPKKDSEDG